jgi:methionyl-tRNA formyltransferase
MKIILIGAVDFSKSVFEKLISLNAKIVGVCTLKKSKFNSDHYDLKSICKKYKIDCRYSKDINSRDEIKWIANKEPDIIICCGWSRLLSKKILDLPSYGVIGYHPSKLPFNRGRHPLIWALALGLNKTASTFFIMNEDADTGDIISQKDIIISKKDDAKSLYMKITRTAMKQISEFFPILIRGKLKIKKQKNTLSNTWRKRSDLDGIIDWRMSADLINNLVRALTKPYIGAHFKYKGKVIKIWKVKVVKLNRSNVEPGKIFLKNSDLLVKCGENAIKIIETKPLIKLNEGEYL